MTSARITQVFKLVGKMLYITDLMQTQAGAFNTVLLNLDRQFCNGPQSPLDSYDELQIAVVNTAEQAGQVTGTIAQLGTIATTAITNYLSFLAPELGLTTNATTTQILTELATELAGFTGSIYPAGGFAQFFSGAYSFYGFPTNNTPTILEAWITSDLV